MRFANATREKIQNISRRPLVRNVGVVAVGTALAQAVAMAFSPLITRLYGPDAFGVLSVFMSLLTILAPVAALTYPIAIVLPKFDADAIALSRLSLVTALLLSLITGLALLLFGTYITGFLNIETIKPYLYLIPVAMFLSALLQIAQQWLLRRQQFSFTSKMGVLQAIMVNSLKLGAAFFSPVAASLIFITTIGNGLHAAMLSRKLTREYAMMFRTKLRKSAVTIKSIALKYKDFPLFRSPQMLINSISQSLPVLILTTYYGPASAGFYGIGRTVLGRPSQLIGKSVSDVFYPRAAQAGQNGEDITKLLVKSTAMMALVGFLPFAIVSAVGPWLFSLVFGAEWDVAGRYAQWMSLWLYFAFLNRPAVSIIPVIKQQQFFLYYEVISSILRASALVAAFHLYASDVYMIAAFSLAGVALNIFLISYVIWKTRQIKTENKKPV